MDAVIHLQFRRHLLGVTWHHGTCKYSYHRHFVGSIITHFLDLLLKPPCQGNFLPGRALGLSIPTLNLLLVSSVRLKNHGVFKMAFVYVSYTKLDIYKY